MTPKGWEFYLNPRDAWAAMYEDMAAARESIDIEQFSFMLDGVGKAFLKLCLAKAREGVRVRILVDMVGSFSLYRELDPEKLRAANVEVKFYNVIAPWRIVGSDPRNPDLSFSSARQSFFTRLLAMTSWFFRDHRKILVIDRKIVHTGGVCIDWRMRDWRDTNVRLTIPVIAEIAESFDRMWEIVSSGKFLRFKKPTEIQGFLFSTNAPHQNQRFLYERILGTIYMATHHVYLTTPYFIPDRKLRRALISAARRGIDVRILVCEKSDHSFVDRASASYYARCLSAGIKIYRYPKKVIHAKTAVIDDRVAFVGSGNLDNLSLLFNNEADVCAVNNFEFTREVARQFLDDTDNARILRAREWNARPASEKFKEFLTRPFHFLM